MKNVFIMVLLSIFGSINAQPAIEVKLWPQGAPEENGITAAETTEEGRLSNSKEAKLYVYLPEKNKNTGAAVLICPGGGYSILAMEHEGHQYARWLASQGIAGIVLKYRMPNGHCNIPLSDAGEAMKVIRNRAHEWNILSDKVGVSGFSAGGHLASTLGTHWSEATRPDFMILFYPVVTLDGKNAHAGSRQNLLGKEHESQLLIDRFSNEKQINGQTPPTLFFLSDDDTAVPPANSIDFYSELKKNRVRAALYLFPEGGHGWGLRDNFRYKHDWQSLLLRWLMHEKFIKETESSGRNN